MIRWQATKDIRLSMARRASPEQCIVRCTVSLITGFAKLPKIVKPRSYLLSEFIPQEIWQNSWATSPGTSIRLVCM